MPTKAATTGTASSGLGEGVEGVGDDGWDGLPSPAAVEVNAKVPLIGCPSAEVMRHSTMYRPDGAPGWSAWVTVLSTSLGRPACTGPLGPVTTMAVPIARAGWSKVRTICAGVWPIWELAAGSVAVKVLCAHAGVAPASSAAVAAVTRSHRRHRSRDRRLDKIVRRYEAWSPGRRRSALTATATPAKPARSPVPPRTRAVVSDDTAAVVVPAGAVVLGEPASPCSSPLPAVMTSAGAGYSGSSPPAGVGWSHLTTVPSE